MKTQALIQILATQAGPADLWRVPRRIGLAVATGVVASAAVCLATLGVNPGLPDLGAALAVKLAYVLGVLGAATAWLARVARPAAPWRGAARGLVLVVAVMAGWAALGLADTAPQDRAGFLLGHSWASCPWRVAALAVPAWLGACWALRGLAPVRPRLAGAVAGLTGGAAGALAYAFFCTEASPAFVLLWYSLGMLLPAALGAALGPRLLRW